MYGLYDQSRLLQPSGEFFLWSLPIPFENFYPLAPPPPRNFHWPSWGGGGYGQFLESHIQYIEFILVELLEKNTHSPTVVFENECSHSHALPQSCTPIVDVK